MNILANLKLSEPRLYVLFEAGTINGITVKHLRELFPKGAKDLVKFYHLYEDNIFLKIFRKIYKKRKDKVYRYV